MVYIVKYFRNFWFINMVTIFVIKYNFLLLLSDKRIGCYIKKINDFEENLFFSFSQKLYVYNQIRKLDKVLRFIPLKKTCLIRSLLYQRFTKNIYHSKILFLKDIETNENFHAEISIMINKSSMGFKRIL